MSLWGIGLDMGIWQILCQWDFPTKNTLTKSEGAFNAFMFPLLLVWHITTNRKLYIFCIEFFWPHCKKIINRSEASNPNADSFTTEDETDCGVFRISNGRYLQQQPVHDTNSTVNNALLLNLHYVQLYRNILYITQTSNNFDHTVILLFKTSTISISVLFYMLDCYGIKPLQ